MNPNYNNENDVPPDVQDPNCKEKAIRAIEESIYSLTVLLNVIFLLDPIQLTQEFLIQIYDYVKNVINRNLVLTDNAEGYLRTIEVTALLKIKELFLMLEAFVSLPKLGITSRDLIVSIFKDDAATLIDGLKRSAFIFYCYVVDLKKFPYTKGVTCYHFETDQLYVVWNMIASFTGLDPARVLECHRLEPTAMKKNFKIIHKDYVENARPLELLQSAHSLTGNVLSPFTVKNTKVVFGKQTSPGWDKETENKLAVKKIHHEGKDLILKSVSENNENNENTDNKKRKHKSTGRFKILYYDNVYACDGIGWLAIKCKFSQSTNGIFQFKEGSNKKEKKEKK